MTQLHHYTEHTTYHHYTQISMFVFWLWKKHKVAFFCRLLV